MKAWKTGFCLFVAFKRGVVDSRLLGQALIWMYICIVMVVGQ